jgi:nitrogen fixation/metabolism regulation signal transduction histidine kinase
LRLGNAPPRERARLAPGVTRSATLTLAARDDSRVHALTDVTLASLALGGFAVGLATIIGWIVARRLTRGLEKLSEATRSARAGDFDFRVELRRPPGDELGELARALNAMLAELGDSKEKLAQAERVAAWQEIARGLAHELKNPLTPIQMSVETLRKSRAAQHPDFDEIFEESTRTVLEEVARLKRIVSEFSRFARLPRPAMTSCDLNELVGAALALYQGAVKVVAELASDLPPVRADRDQLTQVILNLFENARDAIAARGSQQSVGRITVRTRMVGDRIELGVEDNGPGFDPTLKDRIFDSYFTTKTGGTGLGLAIVRRIITEHGGRVTAASTGSGARFIIVLPIT